MSERDIAKADLKHQVLSAPIGQLPAAGEEVIYFALGCFWGAERAFYRTRGVVSTAVGYMAGRTPDPTYYEVCDGDTGHTEAVRVLYRVAEVTLSELLALFWQTHDPTQGNRQGNDVGSQYRSGIYTTSAEQLAQAEKSREIYEGALKQAGRGPITTEIGPAGPFYFAEVYHQQYLHKNPSGYCGLGGTGVKFPT